MSDPIDELTPREREVFELLRLGLTNEEIAERLGISPDGAKYHVSQILSKLGVSSREEAAAMDRHTRATRRWLSLPASIQIAAVALASGVIALVAILILGTLRAGSGKLTPEEVVSRVTAAVSRDGEILHSRLRGTQGDANSALVTEIWLDPTKNALRENFPVASLPTAQQQGVVSSWIVLSDTIYAKLYLGPNPPPPQLAGAKCPGSRGAWLDVFLGCRGGLSIPSSILPEVRRWDVGVENGTYSGTPAIVLVFKQEPSGATLAPSATPPLDGVVRLYFSSQAYLPLAQVTLTERNGREVSRTEAVYENEFLPLTSDIQSLFDPATIGYVPGATYAVPTPAFNGSPPP